MVVRIQTLWIGKTLPMINYHCLRSMNKYHEVHIYTYDKIENIPISKDHDIIIKDANEIIEEKDLFYFNETDIAPFSDLFRYKLLLLKGGYWLDLDIFLLKPINYRMDEFIIGSERNMLVGAYKSKEPFKPNIGFLKAKRKSRFYAKIVDECEKRIKKGLKKRTDLMTIFQKQIEKFGIGYCVKSPHFYCNLDWWYLKEAFESPHVEKWTPKYGWNHQHDYLNNLESVGIHLWNGLISKKKIDCENYVEGSLIDLLIKSLYEKPTFIIPAVEDKEMTINFSN